MTRAGVQAVAIGAERQPLVTVDHFAADPDALRRAAAASDFVPAGHHYPGIRAPVPADYWPTQEPLVTRVVQGVFGLYGRVRLIDASFSIVTVAPGALSVEQRTPHVDAFDPRRIALVHYLAPDGRDGTAFFRHRSTGHETVDDVRAGAYRGRLAEELDRCPPDAAYVTGDTPLFERIALGEARYNRALIYRSFALHSGAISAAASLSADPALGRLTITAFLSVE